MLRCPNCSTHAETGLHCTQCGAKLVAVPPNRVGQNLCGYVLEALVARGPNAIVYRGRKDGELAAVKVYEPTAANPGDAARVRRERDAQVKVEHACVARLIDYGELDDGTSYLVSAWASGVPLEARLQRGPMTFGELVPILSSIGRGLHAIHSAGIVHRDLKPANIMLPERGSPAAVILDFGGSLLIGEQRLTATGQVLGSASYMAPEQASGHTPDGRADLYSLGVIMYRALTGVLPFEDVAPAEILRRHLLEAVVPPRQRAPQLDIPVGAEDLCLWLLAKEPDMRVPNSRVLQITLQTLVQAQPVFHSQEHVA